MSLTATRMLEVRKQSEEMYLHNFAAKEYGAKEFYIQQTLLPNSVASRALQDETPGSMGKTIKVPVLARNTSATVGSSRSCTINNNETSSALVTLSWTTLTDGFIMYPERYANNDIKYNQHWAANYQDMLLRLWNKMDELCVSDLGSYKTAIIGDTLNYTFSSSVVNALWNDRMDIIGDMSVFQRSNNYRGHLNLIGNMGLISLANRIGRYGEYNEKDLRYEFGDKSGFITSNIENASQKFTTMFCVPDGQVAILSRVSREEHARAKSAVDGHEWDEVMMPGFGNLKFGTHYYESVGDVHVATGEDDMICSRAQHFGWAIDIAFVHAYNPDTTTIPQPVIKADLATGSNGQIDVKVVAPIPVE